MEEEKDQLIKRVERSEEKGKARISTVKLLDPQSQELAKN